VEDTIMRELTLVRHGQSEHHVNGYTGGWTDLPLTELGRTQARKTARYLKSVAGDRSSRILSSDLRRAHGTAEILASELDLPVTVSPALRELNNGSARGLSETEAVRLMVPRTEPVLDWIPYPQGESWRMMFHRLAGFLNKEEAASQEPLLIVSHANAMICIILWWLQLTEDHHLGSLMFDLDPCSVTRLRVDRGGDRRIVKLNDTAHLFQWPAGDTP
jgi:probable phosphoglycerate mutase